MINKRIELALVVTAAYLAGSGGLAHGQGGGPATVGGPLGTVENSTLVTAPNNLEQKANEQAQANGIPAANTAVPGVNTAAPAGAATVPGGAMGAGTTTAIPGSVVTPAGTAGRGGNTTVPRGFQSPVESRGVPNQPTNMSPTVGNGNAVRPPASGIGAGMNNAAAGTPGQTYTPGLANPGEWNYRTNPNASYASQANQGIYPGTSTAATPGYTGRLMPGMGTYNAVNPMGTTMAPGYYYAGTAGLPYATYNAPGYSGNNVMPYAYGATTAYPTTYMAPRYTPTRRGLFGRRNRVVYPASPYGYNNSYGSYPSGYTTYSSTTYTTPGSYTAGPYPY